MKILTAIVRTSAAYLSLGLSVFASKITYEVSGNPGACHEVHLGKLSVSRGVASMEYVNTGYCHYEVRAARGPEVYLTATCTDLRYSWIASQQKYAVDLRHPDKIRRVDEKTWDDAPVLPWSVASLRPPKNFAERAVQYKGRFLERSGSNWAGEGDGAFDASLSKSMTRAAVNSWDGISIVNSVLDPASFGKRDKIKGQYWIDLYDMTSGQRLLLIQGAFSKIRPMAFQAEAAWYGDRFYILSLGSSLGLGELGMQRLPICDLDGVTPAVGIGVMARKADELNAPVVVPLR